MHSNSKNKLKIIITLTCFFLCLFIVISYAHSGRTDSNGGHYNRSTGEYHYHTGEYAGRDSSSMPWYISYGIFVVLIFSAWTIYSVWIWISNSLPSVTISRLEHAIHNYKNAKNHEEFCDKELKEIKEKAIIPEGYEIGKDGLPKEINSAKWEDGYNKNNDLSLYFENIKSININWGKSLTVYTIRDGWKLHLDKECCDSSFAYRRNVYSFYNKRYSLCKKCAANYQMPNMDWYIEYLKLDSQEKKCELAKGGKYSALNTLKSVYKDCNKKIARFFLFFTPSKKRKLEELKREYKQIL